MPQPLKTKQMSPLDELAQVPGSINQLAAQGANVELNFTLDPIDIALLAAAIFVGVGGAMIVAKRF